MFKAIMAVDDKGGISRDGSMPWPKNSSDLKWFKKNTLNAIVIMGRATWEDPFFPIKCNWKDSCICEAKSKKRLSPIPNNKNLLKLKDLPKRTD